MSVPNRQIPTVAPPTAVSFRIVSDGNDLGPALPVMSVVVNREINRIPEATIILEDGSLADQTFRLSESGDFAPGKKIDIELGYRGTTEPVFTGVVVGQQIRLRAGRGLLVVRCKDAAYRLTINRRSRYFEDQKDSEALESLLQEAGLEYEVADTTDVVPDLSQHICTDWDFLVSRAEANGMIVAVTDGKVRVAVPELNAVPVLRLEYGANLIDFDAEVDVRGQFAAVESRAWRAAEDETVTEENPPDSPAAGDYSTAQLANVHGQDPRRQYHGGGASPGELIAWSAATARFSKLGRVQATLSYVGSAVATPGDTLELASMGSVYDGPAYVSGIRHELSPGRWTTTAQIGLRPERFTERFAVSAPAAGGLLPATRGLHVATVVQVHDDPAGEERIQVTLPATAPDGAGNWARLAAAVAGAETGTVFRPAVGDEVVVGFLHEDPRFPVILGGLHASGRPSPFPPQEANGVTGYVSRGGHRLYFEEDGDRITVETKAGDKLVLAGEDGKITLADQHGNRLEMASDGITLESTKDLTLKAAATLRLEGASVELSASASASVESGGTLDLRGSLIQLN